MRLKTLMQSCSRVCAAASASFPAESESSHRSHAAKDTHINTNKVHEFDNIVPLMEYTF